MNGIQVVQIDISYILLVAAGAIAGGLTSEFTRRVVGRFWASTVDPQLDRLSKARRERREQAQVLAEIADHFRPNGGMSLIDRVRSIEQAVADEDAVHTELRDLAHRNQATLEELARSLRKEAPQ